MLQNINRNLAPMKAHFFLFSAGTGPLVNFLPVIAKQMGFSSSLVGSLYTVLPISGLIAKPLFGSLADRFRLHKLFFLVFQVVLALAFFSIYFIPEMENWGKADVTLKCDNAEAFVEFCPTKKISDDLLTDILGQNVSPMSCNLSCQASFNVYSELCHSWGAKQFCNSTNTGSIRSDAAFNFSVSFNTSDDLEVSKCLFFKVKNANFDDVATYHPDCKSSMQTPCTLICPDAPKMNEMLLEGSDTSEKNQLSTIQYHWFVWACIISWVGMAVVVSIADAICFDLLGDEKRGDYGKQRMWNSIGTGIFGIGSGVLVLLLNQGHDKIDYSCIFFIMLIAMTSDIIVSAMLNKKSIEPPSEHDPSVFWELGSVAREGRVLVFAFWCIGAGMCTGVIWNFLLWYADDLMKYQKEQRPLLQGLIIGVQCFLGELPFNFISGRILKKLGHINVMSLVLLIYAIRFMAYSLINNAWIFLIVEVLHGPTLGLSWPSMVSYGDRVAPSGTRATMQGLVGAIFEGVGVSSGTLICGHLIDVYGCAFVFRVFSVGALVWLSIYWILQLLLQKTKSYPLHQGHSHLASYARPNDAILMMTSQELQTY